MYCSPANVVKDGAMVPVPARMAEIKSSLRNRIGVPYQAQRKSHRQGAHGCNLM